LFGFFFFFLQLFYLLKEFEYYRNIKKISRLFEHFGDNLLPFGHLGAILQVAGSLCGFFFFIYFFPNINYWQNKYESKKND
jgi:hypothetical protein